jgi:hypothetical protein
LLVSSRAHPVDMVFTRLVGLTLLYLTGLAAPMRGSTTLIPLLVLLVGTIWFFSFTPICAGDSARWSGS